MNFFTIDGWQGLIGEDELIAVLDQYRDWLDREPLIGSFFCDGMSLISNN